MWNPLASLPASNIGALAPYAPAVQPNPTPVGPPGQNLHPLFRQHRGLLNGVSDPGAFQSAMQAWHGDMPGQPERFDPRAAMAAQPAGTQFDPRQAMMDWRTNTFDPWRQSKMDWRGDRPLRSDF